MLINSSWQSYSLVLRFVRPDVKPSLHVKQTKWTYNTAWSRLYFDDRWCCHRFVFNFPRVPQADLSSGRLMTRSHRGRWFNVQINDPSWPYEMPHLNKNKLFCWHFLWQFIYLQLTEITYYTIIMVLSKKVLQFTFSWKQLILKNKI